MERTPVVRDFKPAVRMVGPELVWLGLAKNERELCCQQFDQNFRTILTEGP